VKNLAGKIIQPQGFFFLARRLPFWQGLGMNTASEIIDFVGQDAIMAELKVQADAVRKARTSGVLPASWYDAMERLAGRPLPRSVFSFKGAKE
jgi:hypothetical protein